LLKPDPEFALACASCSWPLTDERLLAIRNAGGAVTDWRHFLRIVERHRIAGLVHNAIVRSGLALPQEQGGILRALAQEIASHNLVAAAETIRLQRLFDENEIAIVFVKGAVLAQMSYGTLSLKHALDIDLLVPRDCAETALCLLERNGYSHTPEPLSERQRNFVLRGSNQAALMHDQTGLKVELHWALTENPLLLCDVTAVSPSQEVRLFANHCARTLANDELFAYLCVHGAHHAWMRLKWLADLNAFTVTRSDCDIERLYRRAEAVGAGASAAQGLLLAEDLLDMTLPETLQSELRQTKHMRMLLRVAEKSLVGDDAESEVTDRPFGAMRISASHFFLGSGWRYVWAQTRSILYSPRDIVDYPLPRFLYFASPLLRVPLYAWRLILNWGRGGPSHGSRKM
jgi:hypothetical protein